MIPPSDLEHQSQVHPQEKRKKGQKNTADLNTRYKKNQNNCAKYCMLTLTNVSFMSLFISYNYASSNKSVAPSTITKVRKGKVIYIKIVL